MREMRFYRCGNGPNFEIFEYDAADGQAPQPRNSDIGGHHLAFYVDDLDAAVAYLRAQGVRVHGRADREPQRAAKASAGSTSCSPWGMQFELVSYPDGKAYERDAAGRCCGTPRRPAE